MMIPNQNSVVFYCKTTTSHACLGHRVHMCVAEPAHALEFAIIVHFSRISQCHPVDCVAKFLFQTCLKYLITNHI